MNINPLKLVVVFAGLIFISVSRPAFADIYIDVGPASAGFPFNGGNYVAGTEFTVSSPLPVNYLGWIDAEGNGLVDSHRVGLWSVSSQALLAEATVNPGSQSFLSANGVSRWYVSNIGFDLTLPAGTYRVAGVLGNIGDNLAMGGDRLGNGVTLSAGYTRTEFPNGGFNYPNLTFNSDAVRATLGFNAIPEPGFFVIPGVMFVISGLGRRRERKSQKRPV